MRIAFRTDASLEISSGHVMRCLTLADALAIRGAVCHFICRAHPGNLCDEIRRRGHTVTVLPDVYVPPTSGMDDMHQLDYSAWLGCGWQTDAQQTNLVLASFQPDWVVLDHYSLDKRWEDAVGSYVRQLMVIDDLANRPHSCDLLLDQNLGRQTKDYVRLVPPNCLVLAGPTYALLRPEFARLRAYSLQRRRRKSTLCKLLVAMGGVDMPNATSRVLEALKRSPLPRSCHITVVMGVGAPSLGNVREIAERMPWPTDVVVNVSDMAQRMADSDLAIGAAGSSSWERCCLGLPTLLVVLAENQQSGATALKAANAVYLIGAPSDIERNLPSAVRASARRPGPRLAPWRIRLARRMART